MHRLLIAAGITLLSGCSVLFNPGTGSDGDGGGDGDVVDSGVPERDAGVTPARCARRILVNDPFAALDKDRWEIPSLMLTSITVVDGELTFSLGGETAGASYAHVPKLRADNLEVVAELTSAEPSGTVGLVSMTGLDGLNNEVVAAAGKLETGFGWMVDEDVQPANQGAYGRWRLRLSGPNILIENDDPETGTFREDGRGDFSDVVDVTVALQARSTIAGPSEVRFGSVVISAPPPEGWCGFDLFDYVPGFDGADTIFKPITKDDGEVLETAAGGLSLRAPKPGSLALARSNSRYDLESAAVVIHVERVDALIGGNAVVEFQQSSRNRFGFWFIGTQLRSYTVIDDTMEFVTREYSDLDFEALQFLRVRSGNAGAIHFEVSQDGAEWKPVDLLSLDKEPTRMAFPESINDLELHVRTSGANPGGEPIRIDIDRIFGEAL